MSLFAWSIWTSHTVSHFNFGNIKMLYLLNATLFIYLFVVCL